MWNIDETGCFWKTLPDKGFAQKTKQCKGGKKCKQRVTVAFVVNAAGESETQPIVIGSSENPRCFKGINKSKLPVKYFSQPKAWMTGEIVDKVFSEVNKQLKSKGRSVLLLMDNAGCHPEDLNGKYSNIKVAFFPPNTTSVLQPLDLGIIKNFKVQYRKLLMRFILAKIDQCSSASEVVKSITILLDTRWIAEAWRNVSSDTIRKCFRKAGILNCDFSLVQPLLSVEDDPFEELDDNSDSDLVGELADLIRGVQGDAELCSPLELISAESDLPVCLKFLIKNGKMNLWITLAQIARSQA